MPKAAYSLNRTRERDLLLSIVLVASGSVALNFANSHRDFPALAGVLVGISSLGWGVPLLLNCIGRYLGLVPDRMTPEQEHHVIKSYIDELLQSIGGAIQGKWMR